MSPKWIGRCPDCGKWNTLVEELSAPNQVAPVHRRIAPEEHRQPQPVTEIQANERVSDELYQRKNSSQAILDAVQLFHRLGIDTRVQVMVDDPMSTEGDHRALFELLNAFPRPYRLYLFSMTVMPGTELERKLVSEGVITPEEVEGEATKTFSQYRVSLDWERPPDEDFWVSMFVLVNKPWLPPALLDQLSRSDWLRRHPRLLAKTASVFNTVSMASMVPASMARGEI